jgi:hypothetical protein
VEIVAISCEFSVISQREDSAAYLDNGLMQQILTIIPVLLTVMDQHLP